MLRYRYGIPARGALPLKKTKTLRRRCEADGCGKLYRHADPRSRACSPRCKQRLYRARKRAADLAEQARLEAENQARLADLAAKLRADMELREAAKLREAPGPTTAPDQPHHPAPPRHLSCQTTGGEGGGGHHHPPTHDIPWDADSPRLILAGFVTMRWGRA